MIWFCLFVRICRGCHAAASQHDQEELKNTHEVRHQCWPQASILQKTMNHGFCHAALLKKRLICCKRKTLFRLKKQAEKDGL